MSSKLEHFNDDIKEVLDKADSGILVKHDVAVERLSICLQCKYLNKLLMCSAMGCGCLMPVKSMFKAFKCPDKRWKN